MSVRGKEGPNGVYSFDDDYMRAPDTRTRWEIFRDELYNPAEGTVLGRTGKKWGIVGLFYLCFFSGLALLCAICMQGLLLTISKERPKWTLDSSIIGTNPGMGFRPMSTDFHDGAMIRYNASNATQVEMWISQMDEFLEDYVNASYFATGRENQQVCNYETLPLPGKVCMVDVISQEDWGPCVSEEGYGFNNSAPCVFVKLNRIFDWVPEYYNDTKDLPSEMPEELRDYIINAHASELNTVWVSCAGEKQNDNEAIGKITYYPNSRGFPGYYYPYRNTPGYLSPLVAVHFERPKGGEAINIECRAWAKNIKYSSKQMEKAGAVHFELWIDN